MSTARTLMAADDSVLAASIISLLRERGLAVIAVPDGRLEEPPEGVDLIVIHASPQRGRRSLTHGVEVAKQLRRDYRYKGRIVLYSIQTFDSLRKKHPFLDCAGAEEQGRWGVSFIRLPEQLTELLDECTREQTPTLSDDDLFEFILNFCDLETYLRVGWSDAAHWGQSGHWVDRNKEVGFKYLLQNTKDFGGVYVRNRGTSALTNNDYTSPATTPATITESINVLRSLRDGLSGQQAEMARNAIGSIQGWLGLTPPLPLLDNDAVQPRFSFVLLADDDPVDTLPLEQLGYRVDQANDLRAARELLSEREHTVFLCDLTWWGDLRVGLELIDEAVKCEVPIIIAMSAGVINTHLPDGVVRCEGIERKHDPAYVHHLITLRASELENDDGRVNT